MFDSSQVLSQWRAGSGWRVGAGRQADVRWYTPSRPPDLHALQTSIPTHPPDLHTYTISIPPCLQTSTAPCLHDLHDLHDFQTYTQEVEVEVDGVPEVNAG